MNENAIILRKNKQLIAELNTDAKLEQFLCVDCGKHSSLESVITKCGVYIFECGYCHQLSPSTIVTVDGNVHDELSMMFACV